MMARKMAQIMAALMVLVVTMVVVQLGRYEGPGMVSWRRYGNLLVPSSCYIDCGGRIQIVRGVRSWTAIVLGATVDCQQIPVAVSSRWLDVFHPAVKSPVFKSILRLVCQRRGQLESGHDTGELFPQVPLSGCHGCCLIVQLSTFSLLSCLSLPHLSFSHLPLPSLSLTSFTLSGFSLANFTLTSFSVTSFPLAEKPLFSFQQGSLLSSVCSFEPITSLSLSPLGKVIGAVSQVGCTGKSLKLLPLAQRTASSWGKWRCLTLPCWLRFCLCQSPV